MYYTPHTDEERQTLLQKIGCQDISELFADIPPSLLEQDIPLQEGLDVIHIQNLMGSLAQKNTAHRMNSFLGAGAYDHFIPPIISYLVSRGEFLTSYTPYQPEVSQGYLQSIFEYQTMICELTGADVSNASLYENSTALWEAILMASRINKKEEVLLVDPLNPAYRRSLETYLLATERSYKIVKTSSHLIDMNAIESSLSHKTSCVIVQYPNFLGSVEDLTSLANLCHEKKILLIATVHPLSLAFFESPIVMGADIIVGEGQPLGIPLSYGGPYFAFMGCSQKYLRQLPGRICGESTDASDQRAYVLTLQAREQHIRREKATSNICTNQALLALRASIYMSYMGTHGIQSVAKACRKRLLYLFDKLKDIPHIDVGDISTSFCECVVKLDGCVKTYLEKALENGIFLGYDLSEYDENYSSHLLIAVTEKKTKNQIDALVNFLKTTKC